MDCDALGTSQSVRVGSKGSKGSPIRQHNGTNRLYWRQSPSSLELFEKQNLKPEQVVNRMVILVLLGVIHGKEVPSKREE